MELSELTGHVIEGKTESAEEWTGQFDMGSVGKFEQEEPHARRRETRQVPDLPGG